MYIHLYSKYHHNYNAKSQHSQKVCPHFGSSRLKAAKAPPPYHAKIICGECESFVSWLPNITILDKERKLRKRIERLKRLEPKGHDGIFVREFSRCSRIAHRDGKPLKLSRRQMAILERIEIQMGVQADG